MLYKNVSKFTMFKDVPKNLNRIFFSLKKALVWQGHWRTNSEIGRNGQWIKALTKKWMMTTYFFPTILLLQKIGIKRHFLEKQSQIAIFLKRCFHFIVRVLAQKRSKNIVLEGSGCHLTSQFLHNFPLPFFCQIAHYLTFDWYRDGVTNF